MEPAPGQPPPPARPPRTRLFTGLGVTAVVAIAVATFAWISIQKARRHSQEETVLCMARQLSAAADQYFLENSVSTARFDQLVGSSNYLRAIAYVAGETYPDTYTQGVTLTIRGVAGTRTVTYAP